MRSSTAADCVNVLSHRCPMIVPHILVGQFGQGMGFDEAGSAQGKDNLNAFHKSIVGKLKPGLYKISSAKFRILGGHAYFLPNHKVAKSILTKIEDNSKPRAVDHEFV